jgi:hypothetical protein
LAQVIVAHQPQDAKAERPVADDPEQARILTSDIALFWRAYDTAAGRDLVDSMDQYLKQGTYGLQQFTRLRIHSAANLAEVIKRHPRYYESIRPSTLRIEAMAGSIRASFRALKQLYGPPFSPTYTLLSEA